MYAFYEFLMSVRVLHALIINFFFLNLQTRSDPQQLMYEAQLNGQTRMFHSAGPPPPQIPQAHPPPPLAVMQQHLDMQQRTQQVRC